MNKKKYVWTKDKIRYVIKNWMKFTNSKLAEQIKVSEPALNTLVRDLRKNGVKLEWKGKVEKVTLVQLVKEVAREYLADGTEQAEAPKPSKFSKSWGTIKKVMIRDLN